MNKLFFRTALTLTALVMSFRALTAAAQMPDAAGGMNSAMIKLFGDSMSFTAKADVQVLNSNRVEWLRMPTSFAGADAKIRVDVDFGQLKSRAIDAATISTFKKMGVDHVISVIRPEKKLTYIIYPGAQSFAAIPLSNEDAQFASQKVEKTALGRETIDGHPCVKNRSVVKSPKGVVLIQATTWNASDLKDFPIKIETTENGNTTVLHFQQVSLVKPEAKLFEPPAGYKQYSNPGDLMAAAYKKASGGVKK
jgi:hypothetical protein